MHAFLTKPPHNVKFFYFTLGKFSSNCLEIILSKFVIHKKIYSKLLISMLVPHNFPYLLILTVEKNVRYSFHLRKIKQEIK